MAPSLKRRHGATTTPGPALWPKCGRTGRIGDFATLSAGGATADLLGQLQTTLGAAYRVERELGGGGMSRVFTATEVALDRQVVVKVLPEELAGGVNVERFRREIQLAAKLQHPHIVPLLAAGVSDGLPYYTMPLIEGESLRSKLAHHGELAIPEATRILRDIADALAYAHQHGVVHRDIKPDNVLISGNHAVVTDFGVAKALSAATGGGSSLTSMGVALGTPAYMAPEQAAADPTTDHRADIYALGAVAYELLTGRQLFAGRSPQQMLAAHATESPERLEKLRPAVPPALAAVLARCLEKRAADRFQTAEEVRAALEALVMTPSGGMTPTGSMPSAPRVGWTKRRIAVAVAAVVVVAGVAGVTVWSRRGVALPPDRVAIAVFENQTGDAALGPVGKMAADWIIRGLSETGLVDVADWAAEPGGEVPASGAAGAPRIDRDRLRAMARQAEAGTIVTGSYYRQGDSLQFVAQVTDANDGRVIRTIGPVGASSSAPLVGVERLRQQVMGTLAALFDPRLGEAAGIASQPPSYEAYREYIAGDEAFGRAAYDESARHFSRAAAIDSQYLLPLIREAYAYENSGRCAQVDSVGRVLNERRTRLTQYEGHYLDRVLARCRGDWMAGYRAAKSMAELAPKSHFARYVAGRSAIPVNHAREAARVLETVEPRRATRAAWQVYRDLTDAYHLLGDYRRELQVVERAKRELPDEPALSVPEVRALAALGRVEEVTDRVNRSLTLSPGGAVTPATVMGTASAELGAHGHAEAAGQVATQLLAWLDSRPADQRGSRPARSGRANLLIRLGRLDEANALADSLAAEDTTDVNALGRRGALAAGRGDGSESRRISDRLAALDRPYLRGLHTLWRARIAAQLGASQEAVLLISEAIGQGQTYAGLHSDPDLEPLRSFAPFRELIRPKD